MQSTLALANMLYYSQGMRLTFYGAAQCVTGSCILAEHKDTRILIDCGMSQGQDAKNDSKALPFDPSEIDYVLLTHAHIDHTGRLPLLVPSFKGTIYCTQATAELCNIVLFDSARIQESDAQWKTKRNLRSGKPKVEPLYTTIEADAVLKHFKAVDYNQSIKLNEDIKVKFSDAGHMLGSSTITITYKTEDNKQKTLVFSGDIGNTDQPILKDPEVPKTADYVVMESTYGMKVHEKKAKSTQELSKELEEIIDQSFKKGGKVIIPAFAIGRSQEILYLINDIIQRTGKSIPTYLDSPMSIRATATFMANAPSCYDEEAMALLKNGNNPLIFAGFKAITDAEESKALNTSDQSCVIIASSGMCEAGRIQHHLKHNLYNPNNTVVFTGYQAQGTLGSKILGGAKFVNILGEGIAVRARITKLEGISGHADQNGLLSWAGNFAENCKTIFVVHGDPASSTGFANLLKERNKINALAPYKGQSVEL